MYANKYFETDEFYVWACGKTDWNKIREKIVLDMLWRNLTYYSVGKFTGIRIGLIDKR